MEAVPTATATCTPGFRVTCIDFKLSTKSEVALLIKSPAVLNAPTMLLPIFLKFKILSF